jgi:hypothetical protein
MQPSVQALNAFPVPSDGPVAHKLAEACRRQQFVMAFHKRLRDQYFPDGTSSLWVKPFKPVAKSATK